MKFIASGAEQTSLTRIAEVSLASIGIAAKDSWWARLATFFRFIGASVVPDIEGAVCAQISPKFTIECRLAETRSVVFFSAYVLENGEMILKGGVRRQRLTDFMPGIEKVAMVALTIDGTTQAPLFAELHEQDDEEIFQAFVGLLQLVASEITRAQKLKVSGSERRMLS